MSEPNDKEQSDEEWYLIQEDRWGFEEIYDGPFDSRHEAEEEIRRLCDRDGDDSWAADLMPTLRDTPKTSYYEGIGSNHL